MNSEAIQLLQRAAESGHVGAQSKLGTLYQDGNCVPQDYNVAEKWLKRAAEQGELNAQNRLGGLYHKTKNYIEAVKWYKKAAEQGHPLAQYNLSNCYFYGYGVQKNFYQSAEWLKKSAEQGEPSAQYNLGIHYLEGYGVSANVDEAVKWIMRAEQNGEDIRNIQILCCIAGYWSKGKGGRIDYEEAAKWLKKILDCGDYLGAYNLGVLYLEGGHGLEKDIVKAIEFFKVASEHNVAEAHYNLGTCYLKGLGVQKSNARAVYFFEKSISAGMELPADMLFVIGFYYKSEVRDSGKAYNWFLKAADRGQVEAKVMLAEMYQLGDGIGKNYAKAVKFYKEVYYNSNCNDIEMEIIYTIGALYDIGGYDLTRNKEEAKKWYRLAANKGNADARERLNQLESFWGFLC